MSAFILDIAQRMGLLGGLSGAADKDNNDLFA